MEFIWNANDSIEYFKKQIECIFKLKLKIKNHVFIDISSKKKMKVNQTIHCLISRRLILTDVSLCFETLKSNR